MTTLDLHIPGPSRTALDRPTIAAFVTGILLVVLMGVPALMAPQSQIASDGWHGNAALSASLR